MWPRAIIVGLREKGTQRSWGNSLQTCVGHVLPKTRAHSPQHGEDHSAAKDHFFQSGFLMQQRSYERDATFHAYGDRQHNQGSELAASHRGVTLFQQHVCQFGFLCPSPLELRKPAGSYITVVSPPWSTGRLAPVVKKSRSLVQKLSP